MRETFCSPSKGHLTFEEMVADIVQYVRQDPDCSYKLIVGTDSHTRDDLCFVSAVIIHRQGKGGRYFYRRREQRKLPSLRQKIFYETAISLSLAEKLAGAMSASGADLGVEIHIDVGEKGDTKDLIREVVGMVVGSGFRAEIKPNSFGASKVADRYTK